MYPANEYKGEKVEAKLTARLVPPNSDYPDCMCELVLTAGHLYVLEDNYDGTYEAHFSFPMSQLISLETEKTEERTDEVGGRMSEAGQVASAILGFLAGFIVIPGKNKSKKVKNF